MAIETGIFDFGNVGFMSQLPHLAPASMKAKGKEFWLQKLQVVLQLLTLATFFVALYGCRGWRDLIDC